MTVLVCGLNHRTAPLALRERFARSECTDCLDLPGGETVILSTCNRFEVYMVREDDNSEAIKQALAAWVNVSADTLRTHLYTYRDGETTRHLMRVAVGLDSALVGETQVLGQVARAAEAAKQNGILGAVLARLFAAAVHAGKRARSETAISRGSGSISQIAARLVRQRLGSDARVLIVGAGEMATLAALALDGQPIRTINRTHAGAVSLAARVQGQALEWTQIAEGLAWADAAICATRAAETLIRPEHVAGRSRSLLLIDLSMPRTVDAAANALPGIEYHALDDLQELVDAGAAERRAAIPFVEAIVEQEAARFEQWAHSRAVAPVINDLQRWAREVAESEIRQALNRLDADDPHAEEVIARMAHRIVGKLLHEPTVRLKSHAANGKGLDYADAVRDLFGLETETSGDRG